jgi:hypothetical protein
MKRTTRRTVCVLALISLLTIAVPLGFSQTDSELKNYLSQKMGLSQDQIASIRSGQPFAKTLDSRTPAEIYVFGVVYINAAPESYVKFASDFNRLRQVPGYLAIKGFSEPPQPSDLQGFAFGSEDVKGLKDCKSGDCVVQLPASTMEQLRQSVNWSAANVDDEVNQFVQKLALSRVLQYQKQGNRILGAVYNDKDQQVNVADQFKYMLSYSKVLPQDLPELYNYLLEYPAAKPTNVENSFYWDNVKFGLKPTLRIVHVMTMHGATPQQPAYVIAEKQLYSSHYFETALDLAFCIRSEDPKETGFYLVRVMGSEQAGLTGFKGSIVRKVAVGRSVSGLQNSLASIKSTLEHRQ